MATEVKLPALGENVEGGDVIDVRVKPGDEVKEGQPLIEVEAEKSAVEVPSPFAGRIVQVLVKKGDKVGTGQTVATIEGGNGKPTAAHGMAKPKAETAKMAVPAEDTAGAKRHAEGAKPQAAPAASDGDIVPAGPATRKLAREWGLDLGQVPGSGPMGRVTQDDVKGYVRELASGGSHPPAASLPNFEQWGPVERKPFDSIRKKTADQVTLAWTTIPHVTQHDLADISDIDAFRKQQESKGPKLTVTAFVLKALAIVLKQFPQFNASLDSAQGQLILKGYYHFGVAVDTERGLLVPVLRNVDKKSVREIAKEMAELAERARLKKITADDMRGGTFTVSNLGGIGGTGFAPIVNYPEVAILGLSRARLQPVHREGQFVPRLLLPMSLSYDHRVIDGADAARFTRRLAEMLENPLVMLLHA
ncbi:MAG: 2-oxo acid dehydrogenase subunit E2 [Planctomycetes bacterium]|nr:2-oxo acid dehydrogenase subunit E2 [Planctomycetota bacterium]